MNETSVTLESMLIILGGSFITLLLAVIGYFLSRVHADFREMQKQLPIEYVRKDDFHRAIDELKDDFKVATGEIKAMLTQIFAKLDGKQDKHER